MAKREPKPADGGGEPGDVIISPTLENEAGADAMSEAIARLNEDSNAYMHVSRITTGDNGSREEQYLFRFPPTPDYEIEIQKAYGAGVYRVRMYERRVASDGVMRLVLAANKFPVNIGPPAFIKQSSELIPASAPGAPTDRIAELMATMHAAQEKSTERFMSLMQNIVSALVSGGGANSSANMMAQFKDFAAGLGALPKPKEQPSQLESVSMLLALLRQAKELATPAGGANVIDAETGDVGTNALLLEGIKFLSGAVTAARGQAQPQPAQDVPTHLISGLPVASAPVASIPVAQQPAPAPEDEDMQLVKLYLRSVIKAAKASAPIEAYAPQVYTNLTDEALATLENDGWWEALQVIEPVPEALKPWFARLRDAVLQLIAEDNAAEQPASVPTKPDGGISTVARVAGGAKPKAAT
jgi:hypothetical protein